MAEVSTSELPGNGVSAERLCTAARHVWRLSPTCTLEVTTSSGKSCGILHFDDPARFKPSHFCDSMHQMVIGLDGTLVQTMPFRFPPPPPIFLKTSLDASYST